MTEPSDVRLAGSLHCADPGEAAAVARELPAHVAATLAEPGCLAFTVLPTSDPLVWDVQERFASPGAFRAHRHRSANSAWGRATGGIERRYILVGL